MVIFSINHKTKTITLASLLRDQYCYLIHNNVGSFQKLHHANSLWGPAAQIQMIERYYKVIIDNYAIVNFASLPKVIDAVGGVEVDLTSAESEYLRNTCGFKHLTTGKNTLSGDEALIYMRIRKGNTGGDTARVNRQQTVIKQMLAKGQGLRHYYNDLRGQLRYSLYSHRPQFYRYFRVRYHCPERRLVQLRNQAGNPAGRRLLQGLHQQ